MRSVNENSHGPGHCDHQKHVELEPVDYHGDVSPIFQNLKMVKYTIKTQHHYNKDLNSLWLMDLPHWKWREKTLNMLFVYSNHYFLLRPRRVWLNTKGCYWPTRFHRIAEHLLLLQTSYQMARFNYRYGYVWSCCTIHTHEEVCPTNGSVIIKDKRVGTIQTSSSQTLYELLVHWRVSLEAGKAVNKNH